MLGLVGNMAIEQYGRVKYVTLDKSDSSILLCKEGKEPVLIDYPLTVRTCTDGYTTISVSDDRTVQFVFRLTDDVKKLLIEACGGSYDKISFTP